MPFRVLALRAVLALGLLFAQVGIANAAPLAGVVFVVIDGDTVLFKPDHYHPKSRAFLKVRLADIDAPEKEQPHGEAATETLKALALNQRAQLDVVATDSYGRKVGRLTLGSQSVNAEMVRRGFAWASTRYRRDALLLEAQREAQAAKRGLWEDAAPTPPWVWRRAQPVSSR
jgi:endonuclease YncB( thermonuclease family)